MPFADFNAPRTDEWLRWSATGYMISAYAQKISAQMDGSEYCSFLSFCFLKLEKLGSVLSMVKAKITIILEFILKFEMNLFHMNFSLHIENLL